jgi:hypothetical protein
LPVIACDISLKIARFSRARCRSAELKPKPVPRLETFVSQLPFPTIQNLKSKI